MPRIGNLREYLAGTGATGALIAGAMVAFLGVGALVAFNGLPARRRRRRRQRSRSPTSPEGTHPRPRRRARAQRRAPWRIAAAGGTVLAAMLPGGVRMGPGARGRAPTAAPSDRHGGGDPRRLRHPGDRRRRHQRSVDDVDETDRRPSGLPSLGDPTGPIDRRDRRRSTTTLVDGAVRRPPATCGNGVQRRRSAASTDGLLGGPSRLRPPPAQRLEPAQRRRLQLGVVLDRAVVAAREDDQLPRLARALEELRECWCGIRSSPSACSSSSGLPASSADRLGEVVLAEPGLERRQRLRAGPELELCRAQAAPQLLLGPPGRSRSRRRSLRSWPRRGSP